jgi:hypothetical protein
MQSIRVLWPTFLIAGKESMNWTKRERQIIVQALAGAASCKRRAVCQRKGIVNLMKNTLGVCVGLITLGLAFVAVPSGKAQSDVATNAAGGARASIATTSETTPTASSAADLDRRVDELERELVDLRAELVARKEAESAAEATPVSSIAIASDPASAQAAAPAGDKPPDKVTVASLLGPTSISGFVDTYYQVNFNHPADQSTNYRAFDFRSHQISLNMIELILDKAPDGTGPAGRTGYHVSVGFGDAENTINASDPGNDNEFGAFAQYLKEAYFSYLVPVGKGLQVDVGKFVTPMGAEVIESKDNWNYSRGLLFTYAIPFWHFGARAKYTFNDKATAFGFLVNGWNNTVDNNSGKTYGMSLALSPNKKFTFTPTYLAGPEENTGSLGTVGDSSTLVNVNNNWRQTWDAVLAYNPTGKWAFIVNGDYGRGDRIGTDCEGECTISPVVYWEGVAGYAKYAMNDNNYLAGRYEYFEDHDGFMTGTGIPRLHFNEFTATYNHTISTHLLTRLEYRRDMTNKPVFQISHFEPLVKQQSTVELGLIFLFDSRDAK